VRRNVSIAPRCRAHAARALMCVLAFVMPMHWVNAEGDRWNKPPMSSLQARGISLDEAVALVQKRYDAKAVKAESVEQRGRLMHRIRLLSPDGKVWTVTVDAQSGQIR
jgi:uncharacterized membrane protein YkoI